MSTKRCCNCNTVLETADAPFCSECGVRQNDISNVKQDNVISAATVDTSDVTCPLQHTPDKSYKELPYNGEVICPGNLAQQVQDENASSLSDQTNSSYGGCFIEVTLNDNQFFVDHCPGVLNLKLHNKGNQTINKASVAIRNPYLKATNVPKVSLVPGDIRPYKIQILSQTAGEILVEFELRYEIEGRTFVYTSQPTIRVLTQNEPPPNLSVVVDQRITGEKIGFGLSYNNEVGKGITEGLIKTTNDLLSQVFSDNWRALELYFDNVRSEHADKANLMFDGSADLDQAYGVKATINASGEPFRQFCDTDIEGKTVDSTHDGDVKKWTLAICGSQTDCNYFEMKHAWFFIGRDENCHITLPSSKSSSLHATVARINHKLFIIDHDSRNGTWSNGQRINQKHIESGDTVSVGGLHLLFKSGAPHMGRKIDSDSAGSIAFGGATEADTEPTNRNIGMEDIQGSNREKQTSASITLITSAGQIVSTDSLAITIGSDSSCQLRLGGSGVARFHAIFFWNKDGVYIEDLYSGRGILLNNRPIICEQVHDKDVLDIGGHKIKVSGFGNIQSRAQQLANTKSKETTLHLTCINGPSPAIGQTIVLEPEKEMFILGRDNRCGLVLDSEEISATHAQITRKLTPVGSGAFQVQFIITDLQSANGTIVNGHQLRPNEKHIIKPGDVVRFSNNVAHCDLLVHYTI